MTKYEAFHSGNFSKLSISRVGRGIRSGTLWAQGWITYKRFSYELPITEDFMFEIPPGGRATCNDTPQRWNS